MEEKNKEKRYFHSTKPFRRRKNKQILVKIIKPIVKLFISKDEVIIKEELPLDEGVIFVSNHAKRYAPMSLYFNLKREKRIWGLYSLFYVKTFSNHMMYDMFPNARGLKRILLRVMTSLGAIIGPFAFRMIEAIPVYKKSERIAETFQKSVETLEEGKDVLIFPESREKDENYKYVNKIQKGYYKTALEYYQKTGKCVKLYPIYCCKKYKKIMIGKPYIYNPQIEIKEQTAIVNKYIQDSIEEMALSLSPHEAIPYGEEMKDKEYIKDKYKGIY